MRFAAALVAGLAGLLFAAEPGITANSLSIGQSAVFSGPAAGLGLHMRAGISAAFAESNAAGGIHGRQLNLVTADDGYEPDKAVEATVKLIEESQVFCLVGAVGTPTTKVMLPIITDAKVPLVGAFTGAGFLRQPVQPWLINLRASYGQETERLVERLTTDRGAKRIAVFYQDDSFGLVGLEGTTKALQKRTMELAGKGTYARNTEAVQTGLAAIIEAKPDAVVMVGTYKALAAFVKLARAQGLTAPMATISFVGTEKLIAELGAQAEGVIISQVVPSPTASELPVAKAYRAAMAAHQADQPVSYGSFEGYLTARVLLAGLQATGATPSRSGLMTAIEGLSDHDLGGFRVGYGKEDHQGSDTVWTTVVRDGKAVEVETLPKP
jgi:ABC-type branched-subunit amino acid transport system substrate-binding protein